MTDPEIPDPHVDDAVRRLLAAARVEEPMPADVADRLDALLLSAEASHSRAETSRSHTEASHSHAETSRSHTEASPTSRRTWLLAAAAVVVACAGGFGIIRAMDQPSTNSSSSASVQAESTSPSMTAPSPEMALGERSAEAALPGPVVRRDHFAADVRTALPSNVAMSSELQLDFCAPKVAGPNARTTVVTWADAPALLVLRPTNVATVYSCDGRALHREVLPPE